MTEQEKPLCEELTDEELINAREKRRQELEKAFGRLKFVVIRKELFAHLFDPAVVFRYDSITFNTACIKALEDVVYVQLLLCEDERIFAVKGCGKNDKDALRWCIAKDGKRKSRKMSCKDFTRDLYRYMGWDPKCRYKIVGYLVDFDGETYFAFDLTVQQIFHEKPKKGEVVTEPVDSRKGYFSENIAGTFGVPLEEHRRHTLITEENGFVNIAMLTGDKKPGDVQLTLEGDQADPAPADSTGDVPLDTLLSADAPITGEVRPVEGEEVPDGESNMEG